jgi:hypothetical protein
MQYINSLHGIYSVSQLSLGSGIELEEGRETEGKGGVGNVRATNETESLKFSLSLRKEECTYNACDILDSHHNSSYCPYSTFKIIFS